MPQAIRTIDEPTPRARSRRRKRQHRDPAETGVTRRRRASRRARPGKRESTPRRRPARSRATPAELAETLAYIEPAWRRPPAPPLPADFAPTRPLDALVVPDPPDHEVGVVAPVPPPWIAEYLAAHPIDQLRVAEQAGAARRWSEQFAAVLIKLEPMFVAAREGAPRRRRRRLPQRRYRRRRPRRAVRAPGLSPPLALMPAVLRIRGRAPQRSRAPGRSAPTRAGGTASPSSTAGGTASSSSTTSGGNPPEPPGGGDGPAGPPPDACPTPADWCQLPPRAAVVAELRRRISRRRVGATLAADDVLLDEDEDVVRRVARGDLTRADLTHTPVDEAAVEELRDGLDRRRLGDRYYERDER